MTEPQGKDKRTSKRSCCVVGCHNSVCNTSSDVVFYSFPGRPWEQDCRKKWIQAVNRKNQDGSQWEPKKYTQICSVHFIGNKKSGHPLSPSYIPTIFPKIYKRKQMTDTQKRRFERSQKRKLANDTPRPMLQSQLPEDATHEIPLNEDYQLEQPKTRDVSTQTDIAVLPLQQAEFQSTTVEQVGTTKPILIDKATSVGDSYEEPKGNRFLHCQGFHGHTSIKSETEMLDLAGVSLAVFALLLSLLPKSSDKKIKAEDKLLIFLIKIKTGLTYSALRVLFGIHRTTVSRIFKTVLEKLTQATQKYVFWPSRRTIIDTMPTEFRTKYPNCRVIIDCSEIRVEQPKEVDSRNFLYSNYKSTFTFKFLIGITPNGMISYISKCYGGRSSDSAITVDSNFLQLLEPGDEVMADKGFPGIKSSLEPQHVVIVMPPFLHNGSFTASEVNETYKVASVRIHVERLIQRVKIYNILQRVPTELFPHIDDIVYMCCVLANLQLPIIRK